MGGGRWDSGDWSKYAASTATHKPTTASLYKSRAIDPALDPKEITLRESRDSAANPASTPLVVAQDVTGSMGAVIEYMHRHSLGALVEEVYGRRPITDPHIMIMGIGDVEVDHAPLQVTQFEAEVGPLTSQIEKIFLEGGGGANRYESYTLAWLFGALHTVHDSWQKRSKKGYLFTVGDEEPTSILRRADVNKFLKTPLETDLTAKQLLDMVSRTYEVFHVIVEEGSNGMFPSTHEAWTHLLGQRALRLKDHRKLSEVIVSAIQINEGADTHDVAASWSGDTSLVVAHATKGLTAAAKAGHGGVARL